MDDLISRQTAIEAIQNEVEPFAIVEPGTTCVIGAGVKDEDVIRIIEQLPSAQPEIIRCKDCKYRYLDGMIWNCPFGLSGGEDFFCAYGAIGGGSGT